MPYSAMASAASLPAVSAQPLFAPGGRIVAHHAADNLAGRIQAGNHVAVGVFHLKAGVHDKAAHRGRKARLLLDEVIRPSPIAIVI